MASSFEGYSSESDNSWFFELFSPLRAVSGALGSSVPPERHLSFISEPTVHPLENTITELSVIGIRISCWKEIGIFSNEYLERQVQEWQSNL